MISSILSDAVRQRCKAKFNQYFTLLCFFLLMGCTFTRAEEAVPPTATTLRVIQSTPVPTFNRDLQAVASHLPEASNTAAVEDCQATAGQPMAQHTLTAEIDYAAHQVEVQQDVRYINRGNEDLPQIVFAVEPNRIAGTFTLESVEFAAGFPVPAYELTGRRLTVELGNPLQPGCALELRLRFQLTIPQVGQGINGYSGYFGYTARQFNLAHWLPTIATRDNGVWVTHDAIAIGEQMVSDIANWEVTLHIANAPENLVIAAPGTVTEVEEGTTYIQLENAREFSVSMSDQFNLAEQTTNEVRVELYSFDDAVVQTDNGSADGAALALETAAQSLEMYSDLFGTYPYDRFVVVEGDFPDGMELTGLVFVSGDWFRSYTGDPAGYLTIITAHETAHQWWYALIGNDQAMNPWLDEALATYSEYIYFEEYYPELKDWWWQYRVASFAPFDFIPEAMVDSPVYLFTSIRQYINAIYLRGAWMLDALRRDLGTDAFFDWLRRYAEAGKERVVTPDLIWSLLSPSELALTQNTRATYLTNAEIGIPVLEATSEAE